MWPRTDRNRIPPYQPPVSQQAGFPFLETPCALAGHLWWFCCSCCLFVLFLFLFFETGLLAQISLRLAVQPKDDLEILVILPSPSPVLALQVFTTMPGFCDTGDWIPGFKHARQAFNQLSYIPSLDLPHALQRAGRQSSACPRRT